jgi:hypothetical protein
MRQLPDWSVCAHAPAPSQASAVHERPSLVQLVDVERFDHAVMLTLVSHAWHSFDGLTVPLL